MKRENIARVIFALLLLCSMGWSATNRVFVLQDCCGKVYTKDQGSVVLSRSYDPDLYDYSRSKGGIGIGFSTGSTYNKLEAEDDDTHQFTGWVVEVGADKCSFDKPSSKTATLKVNGNCVIRAKRKNSLLTLNSGTGGSASYTEDATVGVRNMTPYWCSLRYNSHIVSAVPQSGYRFSKWTISSGSSNCSIPYPEDSKARVYVSGACTVKAEFQKVYTLGVYQNTGGDISPVGTNVVDAGSKITIKATPDNTHRFVNWSYSTGRDDCPIANVSSAITTVTVNGDCNVKANFKLTKVLTVTSSTGGTVSPTSRVVDYAGRSTITATPNSGYRFDGWGVTAGADDCTIDDPSERETKVTVRGDCTVKANFQRVYTVKLAGSNGTTNFTSKEVDAGSKVSISATANYGYRFSKWSSNSSSCTVANTSSASTTVTVNGSCTITAYYIQTTTIGIAAGTGGTVSPKDYVTYDVGSSNAITATPSTGYRFDKWTVSDTKNCVVANTASASTKVTVNGPCMLTADFVKTHRLWVYMMMYNGPYLYENPLVSEGSSYSLSLDGDLENVDFDQWVFVDNTKMTEISVSESVCKIVNPKSSTAAKVVVNGECAVAAKLRRRVTLNVLADEGGTVTPSGATVGHSLEYTNISAKANSGYRFRRWTGSSGCKIENSGKAETRVYLETTVPCSVQAFFQKQGRLVINAADNIDIQPRDKYIDVDGTENITPFRAARGWQFSHFEYKSGEANCPVTMTRDRMYVTVKGDCEMTPVVVPYFEMTDKPKSYYHYFNGEYSSSRVRFHAATEDSAWYRVDYSSSVGGAGKVENYGTDAWTGAAVSSCTDLVDGQGCFIKSGGKDLYLVVSSSYTIANSFNVSISKVSSDYVDYEYDLAGKIVDKASVGVGHGMNALINAENITGYVFKEWTLVDGDCELDSYSKNTAAVSFKSSRCRYRGVYDVDSTADLGVGLIMYSFFNAVRCNYVSFTDANRYGAQVGGVDVSDITLVFDGDTLPLYVVGDTISYPVVNKYVREHIGDTVSAVIEAPALFAGYGTYVCEILPDGIMNGDEHTMSVYVKYGDTVYSYENTYREPTNHDPDAPDTIRVSVADGVSDSVVRSTEKLKIDVRTQDMTDDIWFMDQYLVDLPDTLTVKVYCLNSGDEETLPLDHVAGGLFNVAELVKREGEVVKGDGVLSCAAADKIVTEFVDPMYKSVTRDTVAFGDKVPVDYKFYTRDFAAEFDSVEAMNAEFGFRVTAVSPTLYKADTIMVALFTDAGDTVWVSAVETDVYSSEFVGEGSFKFVVNAADQKDSVLDAAMDLDAESNRVVIYAQVDGDKSELESRDSLVVYYDFIPADSAEVLDKDADGRADFVRVHFVRDVRREDIAIDTVVWGAGKGRGVDASEIVVSADGRWIEAPLRSAFAYGATSDASGKAYLTVSRGSSNSVQKLKVADRVGAVPVSAEKHPGRLSDEEMLNGKTELPPDTLIVTLSEPVDSITAKTFTYAAKEGSEASSARGAVKSSVVKYGKAFKVGDESGRVWKLVLARSVDIRVGDTLSTNPDASSFDKAGNAPGVGGVSVTGEDGEVYLYTVKAHPPVVKAGNRARIKVETKKSYKAYVTIFDNMGNVMTLFSGRSKFEDVNADNATQVSFIEWDQYTDDGRLAGTGVYIWKIRFTFEDGHREWRTVKTGIKRKD